MPNLAMRLPGTMFSGDGLDVSWPLGGEREVVAKTEEEMTLRIRQRIAEGNIVIVDDAPTKGPDNQSREYRLLTGDEAREHMAEPAGPVTRVVYHPATPDDEKEYQLEVKEVQADSPLYVASQQAAAEAAEAAHAEVARRQADAEKAADKTTAGPIAKEPVGVADETATPAVAGKSDPYVGMSAVGRKTAVGITANDTRDNPPPAKPKAVAKPRTTAKSKAATKPEPVAKEKTTGRPTAAKPSK